MRYTNRAVAKRTSRRAFNKTLMDQLSEEECRALDSAIDTLIGFLHVNNEAV